MTIKDFAKLHGVSSQAVYQRMKKAGIDIATIKDKASGHLTEAGQSELEKLYSGSDNETASNQSSLLALQAENQQLNNQIDMLKDQVDHLRRLLDQEQRLHFEALQRIPEPKKPWYKRLSAPKEVD